MDIDARASHHGEMEPVYPNGVGVDPFANPGLHPQDENGTRAAAVVLDVDGEVFELSPDEDAGTHYLWLTGPNHGYGFGSGPTLGWSMDEHRTSIRSFLAQIDPRTGHIEDS